MNRLAFLRVFLRHVSSLPALSAAGQAIVAAEDWAGRVDPTCELVKLAFPIFDEIAEEFGKVSAMDPHSEAVAIANAHEELRVAATGLDWATIVNVVIPMLMKLYQAWREAKAGA
jgi:hypothetical protein